MTSKDGVGVGDANGISTISQRLSKIFQTRSAAVNAAHLIPHLKPHYRILDVGCGPGSISIDLAKLVPEGEVVAFDINPDAITQAHTLASEANVTNITFLVGDATDLSTISPHNTAETFDVIHAHQTLLHLPHPENVLRSLRVLLKPNGLLSTRDNFQMYRFPPLPEGIKLASLWEKHAQARGTDPHFGQRNHVAAHAAGFAWERMELSTWGWEWTGEGRALIASGSDGATRKVLLASGAATEEDMREIDAFWQGWGERADARFQGVDGGLICWK